MTVELKDIRIKLDIDDAADQQFLINVTGDSLDDIGDQVVAFANQAVDTFKARRYEATVGTKSIADLGRYFRGVNQEEQKQAESKGSKKS
jgi:hypothetical protein